MFLLRVPSTSRTRFTNLNQLSTQDAKWSGVPSPGLRTVVYWYFGLDPSLNRPSRQIKLMHRNIEELSGGMTAVLTYKNIVDHLNSKLEYICLLHISYILRVLLIFFTARCTLVQSAVLRSHVVCLSVRPSVCDVGELWSHRLEFFENNYTVS